MRLQFEEGSLRALYQREFFFQHASVFVVALAANVLQ